MSTRLRMLTCSLLLLLSLPALPALAQSTAPPTSAPPPTFTFITQGVGPDFPVTLHRATGRWTADEIWLGRHHYQVASPEYQRLCVDHCVLPVVGPSYRFALTLGSNQNHFEKVERDYQLFGGETVTAHVFRPTTLNVVGSVLCALGLTSAAVGGVLLADAGPRHDRTPGMYAATITGVAALIVGLTLAAQGPRVDLRVTR